MKAWKSWSILVLCFALIVSLAACGSNNNDNSNNAANSSEENSNGTANAGSNDGADQPKEKVELTFWTLGSNNYGKLAEEWNAAHPEIQVKIQNTGDQTAHHNNLLTALSANSGAPDIFMLEIAFVDKFIQYQDKFHNLNDYGAENVKDQYLDWKWNQVAAGDFQLGLPTDVGPTAVMYRADLMEAAGFPADPDGFSSAIDTWEKFVQVAKEYTAKTGKPFTDITDLVYNAKRDQSKTGTIYYAKEDGKLIIEENAQVKEAYDFTVQAIKDGWISKSALWSQEWYADMQQGNFAVTLSPAWMASVIKSNAPDTAGKWKIAQMPEGAGNWGGSFLTLPKESKHPKEAYQFIEWLTGKDNQLRSFQEAGLFPSIPAVYEDPAFTAYQDEFFSGQETGVALGKAAQNVMPVFYGALHDATDALIKDALRRVMDNKANPDKEWKNVVKEAEELVKRQ